MKRVFFIMVLLLLLVTSCKINKEPITAEQFRAKMEKNNFVIFDITPQYADYGINKALVAKNKYYQIEFYITKDVDTAVMMFNENKEKFQLSKSSGVIENSRSIGNSSRYSLQANSKYKVVSRIGDTLIYIDAPANYKKEIQNILEEL